MARTSCFRHFYALPPSKDADGREVGAVRGVVRSMLGMINGGATHVGGRHRSRHRIVPQHALAGIQDRRGHRPRRCSRSSICSRKPRPRSASSSGRWWSSRPTMRWRPAAALAAAGSARGARAHLHARQGPGAMRARHARRPVGSPDARRCATRPVSIAKFGVPPASIPDYLALVGDCGGRLSGPARLGRRSRPPLSSRSSGTSKHIPDDWRSWGVNATSPAALARNASRASAIARSCSARSRRCARTSSCSIRWTSSNGTARRRSSRRWRSACRLRRVTCGEVVRGRTFRSASNASVPAGSSYRFGRLIDQAALLIAFP